MQRSLLLIWWRTFQLEDWRTFQLVSTDIDYVIPQKLFQKVDVADHITIGGVSIKKSEDGVLLLEGDLLVTGGVTFHAQGSRSAATIMDGVIVDNKTIIKEDGKLKVVGGGGLSSVTVKLGETAYSSVNGVVSLPAYPTADLSNYVTLNTAQNITGLKTFEDCTTFKKIAPSTNPARQPLVVEGMQGFTDNSYMPAIGFHIPGRYFSSLVLRSDNKFVFINSEMNGCVPVVASNFIVDGGSENQILRADGGVTSLDNLAWGYNYRNHGNSSQAITAQQYINDYVYGNRAAFFERGGWSYADNASVATDWGVIHLAGTSIATWGSNPTFTSLYITPLNAGVNNALTGEMLFYCSNGEGYNKGWRRVLTDTNWVYMARYLPRQFDVDNPDDAFFIGKGVNHWSSWNGLTNAGKIGNSTYNVGISIGGVDNTKYGFQLGVNSNANADTFYYKGWTLGYNGGWKAVLHSGNWTSYIDGRYLPLTGGMLSGRLYVDNKVGGAPTISLAIGDHDSGLNQEGDGTICMYANGVTVGYWNPTEVRAMRALYAQTFVVTDGYVTINGYGRYAKIGCQNASWCYYETNASYGHNFNKSVNISGYMNVQAIYSTGDTGIRFETYGGGLYMNESTWVRVYGGKRLLVDNVIRASGYTGTGCNGFGVSGQFRSGIEIYESDNTFGIGVHSDDNIYFWKTYSGTIDSSAGKNYLCHISAVTGQMNWYGDLLVNGGVTFLNGSDLTIKKNLRLVTDASKRLMSMGGVYDFEYIAEEVNRSPMYAGEQTGLIYQKVKGTCMDRMCHVRKDGKGSINYVDMGFISLLAAVGMEHETRLQTVEKQIKELERRVA